MLWLPEYQTINNFTLFCSKDYPDWRIASMATMCLVYTELKVDALMARRASVLSTPTHSPRKYVKYGLNTLLYRYRIMYITKKNVWYINKNAGVMCKKARRAQKPVGLSSTQSFTCKKACFMQKSLSRLILISYANIWVLSCVDKGLLIIENKNENNWKWKWK